MTNCTEDDMNTTDYREIRAPIDYKSGNRSVSEGAPRFHVNY